MSMQSSKSVKIRFGPCDAILTNCVYEFPSFIILIKLDTLEKQKIQQIHQCLHATKW